MLLCWWIFPGFGLQILYIQWWEGPKNLQWKAQKNSGNQMFWLLSLYSVHFLFQRPSNVAVSSPKTSGIFSGMSGRTSLTKTLQSTIRQMEWNSATLPLFWVTCWGTAAAPRFLLNARLLKNQSSLKWLVWSALSMERIVHQENVHGR